MNLARYNAKSLCRGLNVASFHLYLYLSRDFVSFSAHFEIFFFCYTYVAHIVYVEGPLRYVKADARSIQDANVRQFIPWIALQR